MVAHDLARDSEGTFLLRIEDIDQSRARSEWEDLIYEDLRWLGLSWEPTVLRQSQNLAAYTDALRQLWFMGVLFPCSCTRRDITEAMSAPHRMGADGPVYPGTCRNKEREKGFPKGQTLRLDMKACTRRLPPHLAFSNGSDTVQIEVATLPDTIGDVVVARRDMGTSYHLSVVVDDAAQGITHVVRGKDLFEATTIHVVLQTLLSLQTPEYLHHRLIADEAGKRLAKRDDARAIQQYRTDGISPAEIRQIVGL